MMEQVPAMYLQNVQLLPPQPQAPPAASDACLTIVHSLMCHRQARFYICSLLFQMWGSDHLIPILGNYEQGSVYPLITY